MDAGVSRGVRVRGVDRPAWPDAERTGAASEATTPAEAFRSTSRRDSLRRLVRSDDECAIRPLQGQAVCYLIHYLMKKVLPNSPPCGPRPFGRLAPPQALDATSRSQLLERDADQVETDAGTLPPEVGHAERSFRLLDGSNNEFRLLAPRCR